jgi:acetyl-CoA C-acetyltransferase
VGDAVIVDYARTAFGRAGRGALAGARSDDMGATVLRAILERNPVLAMEEIVDVYWGCALPHRQQGYNVARQVALLAGLPVTVPGLTFQRSCGSSISALRAAAHAIQAGDGDAYLVGGAESMTSCDGWISSETDKNPKLSDGRHLDFLADVYVSVFDTAEFVAEKFGVSRCDMDAFAARSQHRTALAADRGYFAEEIVPFAAGDGRTVTTDDCPRPNTTVQVLGGLRPICPELGGRVTAGNTCVAADGASALLLMSSERAVELGLRPRARIISSAVSGCEPELMGIGPIEASRRALRRAGVTVEQLDVVECHENFSAQVLPVCDELGIDVAGQLNPNGGALAIGHPPGATGARLVGTLTHALADRDGELGMATTCVAGGMGVAVVLERVG